MPGTPRVRFAPSPTGELHLGNIKAAVINWLFAQAHGGSFLLRIDDTDTERSTQAFEDAILRDLRWLGLDWDNFARQSDRTASYEAAIQRLRDSGRLYACYETPEELNRKRGLQRAAGRPPVYDRAGLRLTDAERAVLEAEGRRPHWRFLLDRKRVGWDDLVRGPQDVDAASLSDPVLIRADGRPLYTITSVVDDGEMRISHVIRGEDHVANTAAQIQLFEALGHPVPVFGHFALIVETDGSPLSKREGSRTVQALRERGIEPLALVSLLSRLGTAQPVEAFADHAAAVAGFDLSTFGRAAARFDERELAKLSATLVHGLDVSRASARLGDGIDPALWEAVRGNLERLEDIRDWQAVVGAELAPVLENPDLTARAANLLPDAPLDGESWGTWTKAVRAETGAKGRDLFRPLRLALTAREHGPEMKALLPLIGRERAERRLRGQTA
ncbi:MULTISPECIES: glutamate--tRNA ligase [unclassified Minwuia]|jgi:glutamyl-tRNA synthetase|uniref:glutamate--tRNA ligase n=1 Tax=unclassified Minwuia TaxID=2618799 RepID=UPI0024799647|nr:MULTISPECIES: glutamate--tRNA ligase [unclassified Minwuia]